jgi:hypothetical protein
MEVRYDMQRIVLGDSAHGPTINERTEAVYLQDSSAISERCRPVGPLDSLQSALAHLKLRFIKGFQDVFRGHHPLPEGDGHRG